MATAIALPLPPGRCPRRLPESWAFIVTYESIF